MVFVRVLILIFTFLIAILLYKSKEQRRNLRNNSHQTQGETDKEFRITTMLFAVACIFILLRFPELILYRVKVYYESRFMFSHPVYINVVTANPIVNLFIVINHSVNFWIYHSLI